MCLFSQALSVISHREKGTTRIIFSNLSFPKLCLCSCSTHMSPSGGHDHTELWMVLVRDDFLLQTVNILEAEHSSVYYQAPWLLERKHMSAGLLRGLRCSTRSFQGLTSGQLGQGAGDAKIVITPTLKWPQSRNVTEIKITNTNEGFLVEPSSILSPSRPQKRVEDYRIWWNPWGHSQRVWGFVWKSVCRQ